MRLTRVKVQNLRCISEAEIFPTKFLSLIGPNNAGKSSLLRAIEIVLSGASPERDEWRKGHEAEPIVIEVDFEDILEWERRKPGVSSLVFQDRIRLRMTFPGTGSEEDEARARRQPNVEAYKVEERIDGWDEGASWGELTADVREIAAASGIDGRRFRGNEGKEALRTEIRNRAGHLVHLGEPTWSSEGVSIPAALQQALPQVQLIPAIRDASEDGSFGAKTSFGVLVKSILIPALKNADEYKNFISAAETLRKRLSNSGEQQLPEIRALSEDLTKRISSLISAKTSFDLEPPDAEKYLGASSRLDLDDGTQTRIGLQGHGLQRALIFAMLEILAMQRRRVGDGDEVRHRTVVLLFEEPELFIHPHLLRRLKRSLVEISEQADWQVIVTTHSPFMIDVAADPRALAIHRRPKPDAPPEIVQLKSDIFSGTEREVERQMLRAALDFHPSVCEAFFADRAILVEGDTEVAALTSQREVFGTLGVDQGVVDRTTVVSCDGKWTIIPVARILVALGIPVRIVHDQDRKGLNDQQLAERAQHEYHANAKINDISPTNDKFKVLVVDDTFEDLLWIPADKPKSSKDKPFRSWCRVRELFELGKLEADAPQFVELVKFAFGSDAGASSGGAAAAS